MGDEKKRTLTFRPKPGAGTLRLRRSRTVGRANEVDVEQRRRRTRSRNATPMSKIIGKPDPISRKRPVISRRGKKQDTVGKPKTQNTPEMERLARALLREQERIDALGRARQEEERRLELLRKQKIKAALAERRRVEEARARLREKERRDREKELERKRLEKEREQQKKRQAQKKHQPASRLPSADKPKPKPKTTFRPGGPPRRFDHRRDKPVTRNVRRDQQRRRRGRITLNQALKDDSMVQRSLAALRRRKEREKRKARRTERAPREKVIRTVQLPETIVVQELANRMAEQSAEVVKALMTNGVMVTQNQSIDADTAEIIIQEFGHKVERVSDADVEDVIITEADAIEDLEPRSPVITVMGHVDHGKTTLLDWIRKSNVAAGEAGGITQHIGAYQVKDDSGQTMTFLDTPGHAAFTSMRSRGAHVTDIVVLVVAADDSIMPQTIEAINHANAAKVPMIVAINKCDRPDADPDNVRNQLIQHGVIVEKRSGDILDVEISALTGKGVDELLETISLQAEMLELTANPDREAEGTVIEAKLDVGRGPVATVLIQNGTLSAANVFVVGEQWGKVRALINDKGKSVKKAGPSEPVEILGLNGTPAAGDKLNVVKNESQAREISTYRQKLARNRRIAAGGGMTLEQLISNAKTETAELNVLVKADVQGSAEAISQALERIGNEEVKVRILHSGVGAITETDINLADASKAIVVGFNVRANAPARNSANQKGVNIRYYSIIYDLVDDIKSLASGLLSAEVKEHILGNAEILEVFRISGVGPVAGCIVKDGNVRRAASVRLLRDSVVIHEGRLKTLKRFKDEVKEVYTGQECGMAFENYTNLRRGDTIEVFERQEIQRTLS